MKYYYVSREPDHEGFHHVHKRSCLKMPTKLKFIGTFNDSRAAIARARIIYEKVAGCTFCDTGVNTSKKRVIIYN